MPEGTCIVTMPDGIRLLTPDEAAKQMRSAEQRLDGAKAKMFASALPAKAAKRSEGWCTPAMPVLAHRPYVESSRGGGDVEHRCQLPLAMVARLISAKDGEKN